MQVGIFLNHYEPHQAPHVAPYGFALSTLRPDWRVRILCSTAAEEDLVRRMAQIWPRHRASIERLDVPLYARIADPVASAFTFYRKRAVRRANRHLLAQFDALVIAELSSVALKDVPALRDLKLIYTGHGMGDPYGKPLGMFDPRNDGIDLILLQSCRMLRTTSETGRMRGAHAVAGYPKFEIAPPEPLRLFDNDRPTVLYNPTQHPEKTSWTRFGTAVLDHFAASRRWNLIFAPHVLLFKRSLRRGARLPRRFRDTSTMKIDLGSRASVDLTYLRAADLYLGDQSSQVYEFINWPRPCVFLNTTGRDRTLDPAFASWRFGPVVDDPAQLETALETAIRDFGIWQPVQEAARDEDATPGGMPASERGAAIIAEFLETGAVSERWT